MTNKWCKMDNKWQKLFNISPADYDEWHSSSQQDSFAVYMVKLNKITLDQYMQWAVDSFKLPFLKESFFHHLTVTPKLWNQVKDQAQWNEGFLPLYEWDNLLFVACQAKPPQDLSPNMIPILVSPKRLSQCWSKINSFTAQEPNKKEPTKKEPKKTGPLWKKDHPAPAKDQNFNLLNRSTALLKTFIGTTVASQVNMSAVEGYSEIFKLSVKYFTGAIVFVFQNKEFTPIEWSDSIKGKSTPQPTDKPSMFRMITQSRSPYHGFVTPNEQHKNFFKQWGFASVPQHVTLIPIFNETKDLIGAFMGVANNPVHQKHLYEVISWTTPLSKVLKAPTHKAQKGAA